jgi:hypothetical protein
VLAEEERTRLNRVNSGMKYHKNKPSRKIDKHPLKICVVQVLMTKRMDYSEHILCYFFINEGVLGIWSFFLK